MRSAKQWTKSMPLRAKCSGKSRDSWAQAIWRFLTSNPDGLATAKAICKAAYAGMRRKRFPHASSWQETRLDSDGEEDAKRWFRACKASFLPMAATRHGPGPLETSAGFAISVFTLIGATRLGAPGEHPGVRGRISAALMKCMIPGIVFGSVYFHTSEQTAEKIGL